MSTKHTPAPWEFDGDSIDAQYCGHKDGICKMLFTNDPDVNVRVRADARLIAAAPDLLAALMALVERGTDSPVHLAAEAAIAKATA